MTKIALQVLLFPAMKPEENKPPGGAIKAQVKCWLEHRALSLCMGEYKSGNALHHRMIAITSDLPLDLKHLRQRL